MLYVTEKERFYKKTLLGAKKLESVHAYVLETSYAITQDWLNDGTLREYSVAGWKELLSRPDVWYRPSATHEFVSMDKCGPID